MQDYIVGGFFELLQFVDNIIQLKKEQLANNALVWNMLCFSFGWKKGGPLNDADDKILIVKVEFDHHFLRDENTRAIGFAAVTHLVLKNGVFSVEDTFQLGGHSRETSKHVAMPTFYFDNHECTFRVPILQRDWNELSDDASIAVVMFNRIQTWVKLKSCKIENKIKQTFTVPTNMRTQLRPLMYANGVASSIDAYEFNDRYELAISIDNRGLKLSIYVDQPTSADALGQTKSITLIMRFGNKSDAITIEFLCFVSLSDSRFTVSSKQGSIKGVVIKSSEGNVGKSILPWRLIDDSEIQMPFQTRSDVVDYMRNTDLFRLTLASVTDVQLHVDAEKFGKEISDPFHGLRLSIRELWNKAETNPTAATFAFGFKDSGLSGIDSQINLIVRRHSLYKGLPFVRVTFIDSEKAKRMVAEHKLSHNEMRAKNTEAIKIDPITDQIDQSMLLCACISHGECRLMRKLLLANSRRVRQEHTSSREMGWYWESFLQLLFRREARSYGEISEEDHAFVLGRTPETPSPQNCQVCAKCRQFSAQLKRCSRCKLASYCSKQCQTEDWNIHRKICKASTDMKQI